MENPNTTLHLVRKLSTVVELSVLKNVFYCGFNISGEAEVESVSSEQSSHDGRSREASSVGESDSPGSDPVVNTSLPAGKVRNALNKIISFIIGLRNICCENDCNTNMKNSLIINKLNDIGDEERTALCDVTIIYFFETKPL